MEKLLCCDYCGIRFNDKEQLPKLFPCCGQTCCLTCSVDPESKKVTCKGCGKTHSALETLITNEKLLKLATLPKEEPHEFQPNFNMSYLGNRPNYSLRPAREEGEAEEY